MVARNKSSHSLSQFGVLSINDPDAVEERTADRIAYNQNATTNYHPYEDPSQSSMQLGNVSYRYFGPRM